VTTGTTPIADFGVGVSVVGERAILAVRGEVDMLTTPDLIAMVDAAIDDGHRSVVLDLAELDFMSVMGLRAIAGGADRLEVAGGALTIRSPSALVRRLLDIMGLAGLVHLEEPRPFGRLGPEQSGPPLSAGPYSHLRRVTAVPSDDEVVNSALRLVVALARAAVGGADGVSVSLRRRGCLATVAASDQTIAEMDAIQYATGEGPCVDASVEGRWFHVQSLDTECRWPAFTPGAQSLGINSILSSPLLARDKPVGALNIYSRAEGAFAPNDQKLASVFATEASVILTEAGADVTDDQLSSRFQEALRTREVIAQAQGVIMERDGVGEDGAYSDLRRFSIWNGTPLRQRAQDVVHSTQRPEPHLGAPPWGGHDG
jgi:anti-anti-sigma factor